MKESSTKHVKYLLNHRTDHSVQEGTRTVKSMETRKKSNPRTKTTGTQTQFRSRVGRRNPVPRVFAYERLRRRGRVARRNPVPRVSACDRLYRRSRSACHNGVGERPAEKRPGPKPGDNVKPFKLQDWLTATHRKYFSLYYKKYTIYQIYRVIDGIYSVYTIYTCVYHVSMSYSLRLSVFVCFSSLVAQGALSVLRMYSVFRSKCLILSFFCKYLSHRDIDTKH